MDEVTTAITWEAPEHAHFEKGADWYWILGIVTISVAVGAFFFGNFLFAILICVAGSAMGIMAAREPAIIPFAVSARGVRIGEQVYPYSSLDGYRVDDEDPIGPRLFLRSKQLHATLLVMPLPEEYVEEIEDLVSVRLPEADLEEPLLHKVLEFFGF